MMFFIYKFNHALEDFEVLGAFSKEEEAKAFAKEVEAKSQDVANPNYKLKASIVEQTFQQMVDGVVTTRLGDLAKELAKLGLKIERQEVA